MTIEDLRERAGEERERQEKWKRRILYCSAAGCVSCGSKETAESLKQSLKTGGMDTEVEVVGTGCMGLCGEGPLVKVHPDDVLYERVDTSAANAIVTSHVMRGEIVSDHHVDQTAPFFASQVKVVLENCGRINAESLDEYLAVGGYEALGKALGEMQPAEIIDEVRKSGLRGRGGAGYSTPL